MTYRLYNNCLVIDVNRNHLIDDDHLDFIFGRTCNANFDFYYQILKEYVDKFDNKNPMISCSQFSKELNSNNIRFFHNSLFLNIENEKSLNSFSDSILNSLDIIALVNVKCNEILVVKNHWMEEDGTFYYQIEDFKDLHHPYLV